MNRFVPFLAEEAIEQDATDLLDEFERARDVTLAPPIPVEDIVEKHLKLRIEFDDMHARHRVPRPAEGETDILGAIYGDGSVFIDESLDPEANPAREGRFRFTLAHEGGGHWRLHRHLIVMETAQATFFDMAGEPKFICRSSQAKERVEWQADFYASCLLMPRQLVIDAWRQRFNDTKPRILKRRLPDIMPAHVDPDLEAALRSHYQDQEDQVLNEFVRPIADKFQVSMVAMRIRLEKLGLLRRESPRQRSFGMRA